MDNETAILAFAALAQSTRLDAFRLIVRHGPEGLAAGEVAKRLAVPHNTLSTHLAVLARAGLVETERRSQSIIYRPRLDRLREVTSYLLMECCGGHPELCGPLIEDLRACCISREEVDE